jgi:hypothetical protein
MRAKDARHYFVARPLSERRALLAALPEPTPTSDPFAKLQASSGFGDSPANPRSSRHVPGARRPAMPNSPKSGLPSPDQVRRMDAAALEMLLQDLVSADDISLDLVDAAAATPRARAIAAAGRTVADRIYVGVEKRREVLGIAESDDDEYATDDEEED